MPSLRQLEQSANPDTAAAAPAPPVQPADIARRTAATVIRSIPARFTSWTSQRGTRLQDVPANYMKGVLGLGPALSAAAGAAARAIPTVAEASLPQGMAARQRLGAAVTDAAQVVALDVGEGLKHPVETAIKYPFELSPVGGGLARVGAKTSLRVLESRAAQSLGRVAAQEMPTTVSLATPAVRAFKGAARATAEKGPMKAATSAAAAALEERSPAFAQFQQSRRAVEAFDKVERGARQATYLERNRNYKQFWKDYSKLDDADRDEFVALMSSSVGPAEVGEKARAAVAAWKALPAQVQSEWVNLGKLTPEAARARAFQPARLEAFQEAVPKVILRGEAPATKIEQEVANLVDTKRGRRAVKRTVQEMAAEIDDADVGEALAQLAKEDPHAALQEAAKLLGKEEVGRRIAGAVEEQLAIAREAQPQARMPQMKDLLPRPESRRVWQMTRAEFEGLTPAMRQRKVGAFGDVAAKAPDPYGYSVERAIRGRRAVPREVLEQSPDWKDMALSPANRRVKELVDELAETVAAAGRDEPMYFPFMRDPSLFPRDFLGAFKLGQRFRPKTLRRSFGKLYTEGEFTKKPQLMAARVTDEFLRYQEAERIIDGILKNPAIPKRRIRNAGDLRPGEAAWSPDGLKLWRAQIDFGKQLSKMVDDYGMSAEGVESGLVQAIKGSVGEGAFKTVSAGFKKPVVYAIPEGVAKRLTAAFQTAPDWVRVFYDAPTALWRMAVLTLRPAWIANNVIGNAVFSTLNGVAPRHYLMAMSEKYRAKTPDELNGISLTAQETDFMRFAEETGPVGQFMAWLNDQPAPVGISELMKSPPKDLLRVLDPRRPAQAVARVSDAMRRANVAIEDFYRRANFWQGAEKAAREAALKRANGSFHEAFSLLDEVDALAPADIERLIARVNTFLHDYSALTPWERAWLRRALPFVNFLKHQFRLVVGLPQDYPGRYAMLNGLAAMGRDAQGYDNSRLPEYLQDKGLVDTGVDVTIEGVPYRAFVSSTGFNPFILGYSPAGGEAAVVPGIAGAAGAAYGSLNPLVKYPLYGIRPGYDPQTGRPLTERGTVEAGGKFWRLEKGKLVEAQPPLPGVAEYLTGTTPQVRTLRGMLNPRAGYSATPFSLESSRPTVTTTPALALLKYFTPASITLVNQRDLNRPPLTRQEARRVLLQLGRQERMSRQDEERRRAPADTAAVPVGGP